MAGWAGHIGTNNDRPAVLGLIAGSPAERAGVKSGEMIPAIAPRGDRRFVDTAGLSMEDSQHLLRGRVGSKLQLRLQMNGEEQSREVGLVRQPIPQPGGNPQLLQQALQAQDRLLPPEVAQVDQNAPDWFGSRLILRTGETLPCRVEAIDDAGVRVLLQGGEPATVAADQVQAVELVPAETRPLTADKFRSLTMLPRSQRQQPPTHVLRSVQGDYLRGRLVSMDTQTVRIAAAAQERRWIAGGERERQHPAAADDGHGHRGKLARGHEPRGWSLSNRPGENRAAADRTGPRQHAAEPALCAVEAAARTRAEESPAPQSVTGVDHDSCIQSRGGNECTG